MGFIIFYSGATGSKCLKMQFFKGIQTLILDPQTLYNLYREVLTWDNKHDCIVEELGEAREPLGEPRVQLVEYQVEHRN